MDNAQYSQHTTGIAQNCPQNIRWILLNILYRIFKGFAQYCPQIIQWMLLNTVHRILNIYCPILSTEHSIFLTLHKKTVAPDWHNTLRKPSVLKADGQYHRAITSRHTLYNNTVIPSDTQPCGYRSHCQRIPRGICGRQSGNGNGFSPVTTIFPRQYSYLSVAY